MAPVGGQVQGISLDSFLQMVQMEKTTCTLRVLSDEDVGFIFIQKGVMISAEVGALSGADAAHEIISWENSVIEIENTCERTENEINQPLMNILMEGLRLRDERAAAGGAAKMMDTQSNRSPSPPKPGPSPASKPPPSDTPPPVPGIAAHADKAGGQHPKEGFTIQKKKRPRNRFLKLALLLIAVAGAGAAAYLTLGGSSEEKLFLALQSKLVETPSLMEKVNLLEAYLDTDPTGEHAASATSQLTSFKRALDTEQYNAVAARADALAEKDDLKGAHALYAEYLAEHPESTAKPRATAAMAALTDKMADIAFARLAKTSSSDDPQRLNDYDAFLQGYPDSRHTDQVRQWIAEMADAYYRYFETQVAVATHEEDWPRGITLARQFVRLYPEYPKSKIIAKLVPIFEGSQKQKADFAALMDSAREKGTDYGAAAQVLSDYLASYPDTYLEHRIKEQISRYRLLAEDARLDALRKSTAAAVNAAGDRFQADTAGTFTDRRTRLVWTLLDSRAQLQECLDYSGARTFVSGLSTGGHEDWRLPTPDELESLYKKSPALPATETHWYWSDKHYREFQGEWIYRVTVVDSSDVVSRPPLQKDSRDCGTVRAVRRP